MGRYKLSRCHPNSMLSHPHYSVIQAYALSFYGYSSVNYYSLSLSVALISPFTLPYLLYSHHRQLSVRNQTKLLLLITGLILSCYYFSTKKRKCQVFFEFFIIFYNSRKKMFHEFVNFFDSFFFGYSGIKIEQRK